LRRAIAIKLRVTAQRGIDTLAQLVSFKCELLFSRRGHVLSRKNLRTWRERTIQDFRRKIPF
jgi:hypothetical protein